MVFFLRASYIFFSSGAQKIKIHYPVMDRVNKMSKTLNKGVNKNKKHCT